MTTAVEAHERLHTIYRTFYAEFGSVPFPESEETAWLWAEIEQAETHQ